MTERHAVETTDAARERHATNLELFLDLVFVFAITQIATLISAEPTGTGYARGLLITSLVWWQWSQFTWAGSAIDFQAERRTRVLVLCLIPVALVNAVAIPTVFADGAVWFGVTYLGVQSLVLVMQGAVAWRHEHTRVAFLRYAPAALLSPAVVLVGAFTDGTTRIVIWIAAIVLDLVGAARSSGAGEWTIDPVHFAERHALFVIIALGEVLVASGATATAVGLSASTLAGLVAAVAVACVLWWTYFAFIPEITEHRLRDAIGSERGRLARDVFTLGHFPLVVGLVSYAVVAKHLVEHPTGHLSDHDRWMLAIAAVSYLTGLLWIQFRVRRRLAPERVVAMAVVIGLCVAGRWMPGLLVVMLVALTFLVMQAVTLRRVRASR